MANLFRSSRIAPTRASVASLFLRLPPSCRAFHASPARQDLSSIVNTTSDLIQTLHTTTHLPWVLTLPLTALLVRVAVILPLTLHTRSSQQRQFDLQPLLHAWGLQIRAKIMKNRGHLGPTVVIREEVRAKRRKRIELYKRWNCGQWKSFLPVLQMPIWLLLIESIRRMCGAKKGLLGLMVTGNETTPPEVMTDIDATVIDGASMSQSDAAVQAVSVQSVLDPTLATEGALWFPDLTVADPMLILPFVLSASMLLNIYLPRRGSVAEQSLWQKRITRALLAAGLAVGPLTLQIPSGILVYWISSSMLAFGQGTVLDRFMPLKRPVPPCKPKMRNF